MASQPKIKEGFVDESVSEPEVPSTMEELPEADVEVFPDRWPMRVKLLYKSIRNDKGEQLKELVFREPRGGDINRYGNPCRVNQEGDVVIDEKKMSMIMAALTGVNLPFLEAMDPRDWNSCAYRLRGFFLPDPRAW
jgi:hypothetical protein